RLLQGIEIGGLDLHGVHIELLLAAFADVELLHPAVQIRMLAPVHDFLGVVRLVEVDRWDRRAGPADEHIKSHSFLLGSGLIDARDWSRPIEAERPSKVLFVVGGTAGQPRGGADNERTSGLWCGPRGRLGSAAIHERPNPGRKRDDASARDTT